MQVKVRLRDTKSGCILDGIIEYDGIMAYKEAPVCTLIFKSDHISEVSFQGFDIFDIFCKLRKFLEELGLQILCCGALTKAFPRGLARSMGGGTKLYLLEIGAWPSMKDLVKIFDYSDSEDLGTVEEQLSYYKKWLESVGQSSP